MNILITMSTIKKKTKHTFLFFLVMYFFCVNHTFSQQTTPVNENPPGVFTDTLNCNGTPTYEVDLTGFPNGTWLSDPQTRDGDCCGTDNNCVQFAVTLDANAEGISFGIGDGCGAEPSGSLFYQVDCGPLTSVGTPLCLSGTGPFIITFCKPGNNENCYEIQSIPAPATGGDVITADGCFDTLQVVGLDPTTVTWSSIPQNDGSGNPQATNFFNDLLSDLDGTLTGTSGVIYDQDLTTVLVTPGGDYPATLSYEVCGDVLGACSAASYCDTVSVTIYPTLFADAGDDIALCQGSIIEETLTGTAIGGTAPFTFQWVGISGNAASGIEDETHEGVLTTTDQIDVLTTGEYQLTIFDATGCTEAIDTVEVFEFTTDIESFINSSSTSVCYDLLVPINLEGYVTETYTGEWAASPNVGTFSTTNIDGTATAPNNDPQTVTWTPDGVATGQVTLTLTPTNNLGCPITPASIIIDLTEFTPGSLTATPTPINCNGAGNGSIDLVIVPGVPDYFDGGTQYDWDNDGTGDNDDTEDLSGLAPGTYNVTVTDENGCTAVANATIIEPAPLVISVDATSNETCDYSDDATIDVSATGGTGTYTYQIIAPITSATNATGSFTGLTGDYLPGATTYTMEVTDANGCTAQVTQDITQPDQVVLSVAGFTNETCD